MNKDQALKILNHFPAGKRNFRLLNIFKGSRDGWTKKIFSDKVFNKGPTLILLKTTQNAICGGFTTVNWENINEGWKRDTEAFVFNVDTKFTPNNYDNAIYTLSNGFCFGNNILTIERYKLNENATALCWTGKLNYYDIEGDVSPLTGEKEKFQCAELEVYRVIY